MTNTFNNKEIRAIYDLYIYGLSTNEIRSIFFGKTIYEIIQERLTNENIGFELENADIVNLLNSPEERKKLINILNVIKEEVKPEAKDKVDNITLLIKNVDKIINDCIKNIIIRDKKEINNSIIIEKITEESPYIISKKSKNIISEEEWKRLQQIVTDN